MKNKLLFPVLVACFLLSACAAHETTTSAEVSADVANAAGQTLTAMYTPSSEASSTVPATDVFTETPTILASGTDSTEPATGMESTPVPGSSVSDSGLVNPTATPTAEGGFAQATPAEMATTEEATSASIVQATSGSTAKCNDAKFINDVSIPDNTVMSPGKLFVKTWAIKNTGSCNWDANYQLKFYSGNKMSGKDYKFTTTVYAGNTTTISITMYAPDQLGTYTGTWSMTYGSSVYFGNFVTVKIIVQ